MPNQVTITGKTGPAQQLTTKLIQNVTEVEFDMLALVLRVYTGGSKQNGTLAYEVGMDSFTSVACTVTGTGAAATFAFTIS